MTLEMRSPTTLARGRADSSQIINTDENISVPIPVQVLGDEIRLLRRYVASHRLTKFEAETRLAEWNINYPPGMSRYDELALLRAYRIEELHPDEVSEAILSHVDEDEPKKREYRTPQSTVDAFWYVARNHDADCLARWLRDRPQDAGYLRKLLAEKSR
jgi:hypothetical protein